MPCIFVDFDDTLSDPFVLVAQFTRRIGAMLASAYGGEAEDWAKAAIDALVTLEQEYIARFVGAPLAGYNDWLEAARLQSAGRIFGAMGLPVPADAVQQAKDLQFHALSNCGAIFPGAAEALTTLVQEGFTLHLASGQESEHLRAALIGAGLEKFITRAFGPDLIDCAKEGPEYYARIFAAIGVTAGDTLVVDDQPDALRWAMQAGAKTIQARLSAKRVFPDVPGVTALCTDLNDLPAPVKRIFG